MGKKLIENGIIVTMNPRKEILTDSAIFIEDDRIAEIGEKDEIKKKQKADVVIDAKEKLIIPGLVSLHFHSDNMSRGIGEHMGLEKWLENIYYPMLAVMTSRDVYASASLAYAEAVLSGTTTVNDMYHHLIDCADAAEKIGIRAVLSSEAADLIKGQESLEDNEKAFREKNGSANGRIRIWFGVEDVIRSSPEFVRKAREYADKYRTGVHIHLNESRKEIDICLEKHGKRPTELANYLGVLGEDVVAAHCVWLSDNEKKIFANTGAHVAHCPVSNMKLGNGIAPIPELMKLGVNVGIGPDDAPCNNTVNMFETMKFASLVQKARLLDAAQMPAETVMEMATVNGAKALGMGDKIGSIEVGKKADIVLLDSRAPNMRPLFMGKYSNIYQHLVYVAPANAVDTVIVDGKIVVESRELKTMNLDEIIDDHQEHAQNLIERRKEYL